MMAVILSLLHTFPFVVQGTHEIRPNTDGLNPHGYSQLYYSWHVSHKVCEWLILAPRSYADMQLIGIFLIARLNRLLERNRRSRPARVAVLGQFYPDTKLLLRALQVDAHRFRDSLLGVLLHSLQQPPYVVVSLSDRILRTSCIVLI